MRTKTKTMEIWDKKLKGLVKFTPSLPKGGMNRAERRRLRHEEKEATSQQQRDSSDTKREDS